MFRVFNHTDNIYVTSNTFETKEEAKKFAKKFLAKFKEQGYYLDAHKNEIPLDCIRLEIIEEEEYITQYTDDDALSDGSVLSFTVQGKNIPNHRITTNALDAIAKKHNKSKQEALEFAFYEMMPLVSFAVIEWENRNILQSNLNFRVGNYKHGKILWFIPNDIGGITVMLPNDY